jgi:hypothetical protein
MKEYLLLKIMVIFDKFAIIYLSLQINIENIGQIQAVWNLF